MLQYLFRFLGLTPEGCNKSGKREAAWTVFGITVGLTVYIVMKGADVVNASVPFLMVAWPSSIALIGGAYKLEHDLAKIRLPDPVRRTEPRVMDETTMYEVQEDEEDATFRSRPAG